MPIVTRDIVKIMEFIITNHETNVWLKLRIDSNLFLLKSIASCNCLKMFVPQFFFGDCGSLFHDEKSMYESKFRLKAVLQNSDFNAWKVFLGYYWGIKSNFKKTISITEEPVIDVLEYHRTKILVESVTL